MATLMTEKFYVVNTFLCTVCKMSLGQMFRLFPTVEYGNEEELSDAMSNSEYIAFETATDAVDFAETELELAGAGLDRFRRLCAA